MRHATTILIVAALLGGLATPAAAEPPEISDSARAVLEQAVEAMGGDEALARVTGLRQKMKGTYKMGEMPVVYTAETSWRSPDRFVWHLDAGMFKASMGIHGETAWSHWMGPPARVKGPMKENMQQWLLTYQITLVRPLLHMEGVKITGGGNEVQVQFPGGAQYKLTFDRGYLSAFVGDIPHWDGRKATHKVKLSGPQKFGDITLPAKVDSETIVDGKVEETMVEETTAIDWNPDMDDEAFVMPTVKLELLQASVKTAAPVQGAMLVHEGDYERLGETITKAYAACQQAGLMVAGSVNAIFLNSPDEVNDPAELRTEIVVPVVVTGDPSQLPEGLTLKTIPAGEVAAMTARGPYGKADVEALQALLSWVWNGDYLPAGPPRVVFFHNPEMTVEDDLVSEVQVPIRKKQ